MIQEAHKSKCWCCASSIKNRSHKPACDCDPQHLHIREGGGCGNVSCPQYSQRLVGSSRQWKCRQNIQNEITQSKLCCVGKECLSGKDCPRANRRCTVGNMVNEIVVVVYGDSWQLHCGEHSRTYRDVDSLCCTYEANVALCVQYTSIIFLKYPGVLIEE